MSVQDDKDAAQNNKDAGQDDKDARQEGGQQLTEKPEPDEGQKEKAAEMMKSYEDRPTLVLPGTGGKVSGTAVNDWLDDDGNPKQTEVIDRGSQDKAKDDKGSDEKRPDDQGSDDGGSNDKGSDEKAQKEQIEKDKAWNDELREAAAQENKGEKSKKSGKS
jgi:hypothetical protein